MNTSQLFFIIIVLYKTESEPVIDTLIVHQIDADPDLME